MRVTFGKYITTLAKKDKKVTILTGDLGHGVFEELAESIGPRFINAGVAEHNMVTTAAGMSYVGMKPWIYSAAPFVTIKVLEEIRNDVSYQNNNVKIVGLGGGHDYSILGPTHHILQDVAMMLTLPNMRVFAPAVAEDMEPIMLKMYTRRGPDYIRLTKAEKLSIKIPRYKPLRRLSEGKKVTVIVLGSMIKDVVPGIINLLDTKKIDLWVVCELPFKIEKELLSSINKTKNICIIEEHVRTGGLGEYMSYYFTQNHISLNKFTHLFAKNSPPKRYGSRNFYLKQTGLDSKSIKKAVSKLI